MYTSTNDTTERGWSFFSNMWGTSKTDERSPVSKADQLKEHASNDKSITECTQQVFKEQSLTPQKNKLDFSHCCDLTEHFLFVCQHISNITHLKLSKSKIPDETLQEGLPSLVLNSPNLQSLSLSHMTYSAESLRQCLEKFKELKELNVDCLYLGSMPDGEFAKQIIPWIKKNQYLESFKCPQNSFSRQDFIDLFDSFSNRLHTLSIGFNAKGFTKEDFIDVMRKLSKKCQNTFKNLCIGIWTNSDLLDDETITMLPQLFPKLERLDLNCNGNVSGEAALKAFMQWENLKNLNLLIAYPWTVEQYSILIKKFKNINAFVPGTSCKEKEMEAIAPLLIENSGETLKTLKLNYIFNSEEEDKGLKALIPVLPQLHSFDCLWHQMNDKNLNLIVSHLGKDLKKFYAWAYKGDTNLTYEGLYKGFLTLAERCPNLEELGLAGPIFDILSNREAIEHIPYVFKKLKVLDLKNLSGMFDPNILLGFIQSNLNLKIINVEGLRGDFHDFERDHPEISKRGIRIIY